MDKKDYSADNFDFEAVTPARRGLSLTRSVYIALIIVVMFAILEAALLNVMASHVQLVNIPHDWMEVGLNSISPNSAHKNPAETPAPLSMPLIEFSGSDFSGMLLSTITSTIITWPIIAYVLKQASGALFGGRGKFYPDMLAGIGFTYVIKIASTMVAIVLLSWMPVFEVDYTQIAGFDLLAVDYFTDILNTSPYYQLACYVRWAGLILSSCYGVIIVKKVEKIELWQAAVVVGLPLLAYIGLNYFRFFDTLAML